MNAMRPLVIMLLSLTAHAASADQRAGTPDNWPPPMPDPGPFWMVTADRLESTFGESDDAYAWDVHGWYGGDRNRVRWKSEGGGTWGEQLGSAEFQVLFSRLGAPYWEWQAGLRHDTKPGDGTTYAVVGLEGTAPYLFEVDAALFVSEDGDLSARLEVEYDLRITQRLILQPRLELASYFSAVPDLDIASNDLEAGLEFRLRYEFRREFAPYLGAAIEHFDSDTETVLLAGLHFWF